jgi:uncharacterized protein YbjQ (UPF0145 family)
MNNDIFITTTSLLDSFKIVEYLDPLYSDKIVEIEFLDEVAHARKKAIDDIINSGKVIGANAIINLSVSYQVITSSSTENMLLLTVSGSAVKVEAITK